MFIVNARIRRFAAAFAILVIAEPVGARTAPSAQAGPSRRSKKSWSRRANATRTFRTYPSPWTCSLRRQIAAAGIESPRDFIAMVPNMTLVETQNIGNSFITVRGISQARNSEPSVAVLVDGVLEPNPYEFTQSLYDIQQIEVLKGPQGAFTDAMPSAERSSFAPPTRPIISKRAPESASATGLLRRPASI